MLGRFVKNAMSRVLPTRSMAARKIADRAAITTFHRVNDRFAGDGLTLSARQFEDHCRFYRDHFDVVELREIVGRLETGEALDGLLAITFDDGYLDNVEVAAPILSRLSLPATFFIATGYIATERVAPWDADAGIAPAWMDWDQVRSLHEAGFEIGGHTVEHVDLGAVDVDVALKELRTCRAELGERIGRTPDLFAYPFGGREHLSEANRAAIREAGFSSCVSCFGGTVVAGTDPYAIPRIGISSYHARASEFAFDLAFDRL